MKNFILIFIFFNAVISFSEIPDFLLNEDFQTCKHDSNVCGHSKSYENKFKDKLLNSSLDTNLDILNYDLYLDWTPILSGDEYALENKIFNGIQSIKFKINNSAKTIKLNAVNLEIDSIFLNKQKIESFTLHNGTLEINFPQNLKSNNTYDLIIFYRNNGVTNAGFYLYPKGIVIYKGNNFDNLEKLAATFSQPEMARNWMPCNDVPNDKAFAKISVRVPEGYEVASNGLLLDKILEKIDTSNYITFVWEDKNHPISTYLMAVTASKYSLFYDEYKKEGTGEVIPIMNYFWKEDSLGSFANGDTYDAVNSLKNTPNIIKAFSQMFGEYAFDKYGHVTIQPFNFGGMEHQTITSINRSWLRGNAEIGIAHEIAHHWIGDLITCETWQDIWINEGGATWFEALWTYAKNLMKGQEEAYALYNKYYTDRSWRYLSEARLNDKILNETPTELIFSYTNLTYTKASWVYHMLFRRLNNDFLDFMSYLFVKFKYDNISTSEFEFELNNFVASRKINFDVKDFFNQVVYKGGHPSYYLFLNPDYSKGGKYDYKAIIEQVQDISIFDEVYNYHVKVDCYVAGKLDTSIVFYNNQRQQEYEISLSNKIDSVNIDRSYTLCNVWANIVSVKELEGNVESVSLSPNPINFGENINVEIPAINSDLSIEVYDILGNLYYKDIIQNSNNIPLIYTFSSRELNTGSYILVIKSNKETINKKFVVLKN